MLLDVVACCCTKFETGQTFQPTTSNISFVPWSLKCSATMLHPLHSSFNIVGAMHAHYARFTKTYGLYPSHDALQVPTLLGVVASVCTLPNVQVLLLFSNPETMASLVKVLFNWPQNMPYLLWGYVLCIVHSTVTSGNEAVVDLVLTQPFLLCYVNHVVVMLTSIFKA